VQGLLAKGWDRALDAAVVLFALDDPRRKRLAINPRRYTLVKESRLVAAVSELQHLGNI
jgi:hypothetical protein